MDTNTIGTIGVHPGRAFSDKRHAHHAYGDGFFLEGSYNFCGGWTVGLGLKYQYWKATHGKERPKAGSFSAVGISDTEVDKAVLADRN